MLEIDSSLSVALRVTSLCRDGCNPAAIMQALERATGENDVGQIIGVIEDLFYSKIAIDTASVME